MPTIEDCMICDKECPQAERAHNIALGRMYAINKLIEYIKKYDNEDCAKNEKDY